MVFRSLYISTFRTRRYTEAVLRNHTYIRFATEYIILWAHYACN